jgi:aminopeptidase-like protein
MLERLLCLLSLADGDRTLMEIAEHIGCSVRFLDPIARHLLREGLLEEVDQ